jgi:hypothetical protein
VRLIALCRQTLYSSSYLSALNPLKNEFLLQT